MVKPKRTLENRGREERAANARAANKREAEIAKQYFNAGPSIGNLARAAYHWYNSVPGLGGQNESGYIYNTGEPAAVGIKNYNHIVRTADLIGNLRKSASSIRVSKGYSTVKPNIRTKVGDVEIDNPELYYHQSDAGKAKNFVSTGRMRTPLEEYWLAKEEAGEKIPLAIFSGAEPGYPQDPGSAMFAQGKLWYGLTPNKPDLLVTAREMPIANKNAHVMSNKASLKALEEQGARRVTSDNIYTQGPHNRQNTAAYLWEPDYGYKKVVEESPIVENVFRSKKAHGGSIHIAPSKRGTFTAAATKHGMGVQEFASRVLRNKQNYSPAIVKKANFARNASKWN